jgi:Ca-activated chloride channel family protein
MIMLASYGLLRGFLLGWQRRWRQAPAKRRRGAIVVLVALLLGLFLAAAAFSVDVAYMQLVTVELRASTDSAATAAVETLGRTKSTTAGRNVAIQVAAKNRVAGSPLILQTNDIVFGRSVLQSNGTVNFTANAQPFNAARVTGRKVNGSPSGAAPLFFARIFDVDTFQTQRVATAARWDRDIALVIDRSGSMLFDNKLEDARAAVGIFLDTVTELGFGDQIGLSTYNHTAFLDNYLTTNLDVIRTKVNTMIATGQTNIGGGIVVGIQILASAPARPNVEKTIVLMTDGRHNTGFDPIAAARNAQTQKIVIHAINFGSDADDLRMQTVAEMTGGTFHSAPDGEKLKEIYRNIALMFGTMLIE